MRFLAEANLSVVIRREEQHVDPADARAQLNDRIRDIFDGKTFEAMPFPGGPFDVPDEVGSPCTIAPRQPPPVSTDAKRPARAAGPAAPEPLLTPV